MSVTRYRVPFMMMSLIGIIALFVITYAVYGGFAQSIAFNGGVRFSLSMPPGQGKAELDSALAKAEFKDFQVRQVSARGNQFDLEFGPAIRDKMSTQEIEQKFLAQISGMDASSIISRETIDASYGTDLFVIATRSLILTFILIGVYLTFRFDFPFALGASLALLHDVIFTIGFIGVMQIQPSIPVVAAVLTIVGYSINDTIVIFDRIRASVDNTSQLTVGETMDNAITMTYSRTIITSLLTLLVVIALLFGGATSLYDFALILVFGIVVGTYSSIFVASPLVQIYVQVRERLRR